MASNTPKPWERQEGETDKAFSAFIAYRDTPAAQRSLDKLSRERTWNVGRWHSKNRWVERVKAWDDELDRVARTAKLDEIRKMNQRHVQIAQAMITKAAHRLNTLDVDALSPAEVRQYFNDAARLERLAMGEPESHAAVSGGLNLVVTFKTGKVIDVSEDTTETDNE
jgi:hypothetical protein